LTLSCCRVTIGRSQRGVGRRSTPSVSFFAEVIVLPLSSDCFENLLFRLEEAEAKLNQWIAEGKPLELCDELADLTWLAGLAGEYRAAVQAKDAERLDALTRTARVALLPKTAVDRRGTLLLFHAGNDLSEKLKLMYVRFAESMHCSAAPVHFCDGAGGLCIRAGDLLFHAHQYLKNETGVHCAGGERCAVCALPLPEDVSSDGFHIEGFARPEDRRIHKTFSCARVSRDGMTCKSLSLRSAVQNRDLALSALAARLAHPILPTLHIRDYDFACGTLSDRRLEKCFSTGDLMPLFESLLLAE